MKQYIRKPIKVEAIQWTGDNFDEVNHFFNLIGKKSCATKVGDFVVFDGSNIHIFNEMQFKEEYEEVETKEEKPPRPDIPSTGIIQKSGFWS